jgi:uncharacterized repeat protein (TIGR02543 family)
LIKKNGLPLLSILLLFLLLSNCQPTPHLNDGILKGQVLVPVGIQSKSFNGETLPYAAVHVVDPITSHVIAIAITDGEGYYQVLVPAGGPYLLEVVKKRIRLGQLTCIVEAGTEYDLGTVDCLSTAAALIVQVMLEEGALLSEIDCAIIMADPYFSDVSSAVCSIIEYEGDPTTSIQVTKTIQDFLHPPAPSPTPSPPPIPTYTVTFDENGGDTTADPITMKKKNGQSLGILPTPPTKANYTFTSWNTESDGSGTEFTGSTIITADITVYAQWLAVDYTLALSVAPTDSGTTTGEGIYHVSDEFQIIATANTGFTFVNWTDDDNSNAIVSTDATHDFTMPAANVKYTANFVATYALIMAVDPIGSGMVSDNTNTGSYTEGTVLNISAAPKAGYEFIKWSTPSAGTFEDDTSSSTTFTMPAEASTVTANFGCTTGYIYNGDEYDNYWTFGYIEGSGYYSKDNNYLYLTAGDYGAFAERSYVTDYLIDLTCINSIVIDWSNTGDDYDSNMSYLVISSSSKHGNYDTDADARLEKNKNFDRSTDTLNVSSLSGSYYIRVHARDNNSFQSGDNSRISVYSIELRE